LRAAATRLKSAAPAQFNAFVTAFREYTALIVREAVQTNEHTHVGQGQARQCLALLEILENIGVRHG